MLKKFLICGKGGAGKSTVAALLAMAWARRAKKVFLVDADESNIGLYRMLDLEYPQPLMEYLGGKAGFKEKLTSTGLSLGGPPPLFPKNLSTSSLPDECISSQKNIIAMSVGKIHHFGEGCACPMGKLFRLLFSSLQFDDDELVLIDTAAGVEHFGRRLDEQCEHILCVLDPSYESVMMGKRVVDIAKEAGLAVSLILNKTTPDSEAVMRESLSDMSIIATIPNNMDILSSNLKGEVLNMEFQPIESVCDALENLK